MIVAAILDSGTLILYPRLGVWLASEKSAWYYVGKCQCQVLLCYNPS